MRLCPWRGGGIWARTRSFIARLRLGGSAERCSVYGMNSSTASRQPGRLRALLPAIGCAVAGAAVFQFFGNATRGYVQTDSTFWWWISQWIDPNAETGHGWLILGLSGWLLWRNLKGNGSIQPDAENGRLEVGATLAMAMGLVLNAAGFVAQQTRLGIVGLLIFTWGVLALGGRRRWARAAAFPLGFMVFAIPVNVLDTAGFWLRMSVVDSSTVLAHAVGIDVVRSGTQLLAPDGRYQYDVAAACSGVRSLAALAALSLLIGYLNFRACWRRTLLLLMCVPLIFVGNLARIGSIVLAAHWGGEAWGTRAHAIMGYGVFVIVLGGVLGVAGLLRRWWPEKCEPKDYMAAHAAMVKSSGAPATVSDRRPWLAAAVVVAMALGEVFFLTHFASHVPDGNAGVRLAADGTNPVELPAFLGTEWIGRRIEVSAVEREILPADTGFSRKNYVRVADGSQSVFLSIVLSGRDRTSIHRPELCIVGQGWSIFSSGEHRFSWPDRPDRTVPVTLLSTVRTEARDNRRVPTLVAYWFVNGDTIVSTHWERFLYDVWNRLRHGRVDRWAYVLMQTGAYDGEQAALERMQHVLDATLPEFLHRLSDGT